MRLLAIAMTNLLAVLPTMAAAEFPSSFSAAKRLAEQEIYYDQDLTFYCQCNFDVEEGPELASCGYEVRKQPKRANRIEWEHIVPAFDLGRQFRCWQEGGRDNCRSTNPTFRRAEADLHNLVPTIGEVNGDRSNMRYGMVAGLDAYQYGQCQAQVSFEEDAFEPPARVRGDIARTYWYMRDVYNVRISRQQQQLFTAWANMDPVDSWERERNRRIMVVQGNGNPYVSDDSIPAAPAQPTEPESSLFSCSPRKTCGTMASCEEAMFHLQQCGNGRLDRDNDGIPCESICR
ncbi:endonuclease [Billgrantia azerbaijanica]|nr:endonuclease [Halomonas azerbaijanica]